MTRQASSLIQATLSLSLALSACTAGEFDTPLKDGFHTGWIPGPNGDYMQVRYELSDGVALLDGDIILNDVKSEKPAKFQRAAMIHNKSWLGAVVPYEIGAGFNSVRKGMIEAAMKDWSDNTPFVFVERTTENDYVRFVDSDQCRSSIGRVGGMQDILVGTDCGTTETAHEIGHAVGFFHEQARQDRDDFITIDFSNVLEAKKGNFDKYLATNGSDFGPYEHESLMHYPALIGDATFVADTTKVTITKKDGSTYTSSAVLTGLDRAAAFRRADVDDPIKDKWLVMGNNLGFAQNSPLLMSDGTGRYLPLQHGRIYHHLPNKQAYAVYGAILAHYLNMGGESAIGGPITDEASTPDGVGRYTHFASGSIYWSPSTGAQTVYGDIRNRWASLGWERSALRYPTSPELGMGDGIGRVQHFQGGSLYWSPNTGAQILALILADKWSQFGTDKIGYPVSDTVSISDEYGLVSHFEQGAIYWSPDFGAHVLTGPILAKYLDLTAENSLLGYPTADEKLSSAGGGSQRFQRGWLVRAADGTVTVKVDTTVTGPPTIPGHPLCHFLPEGC